MHKQFLFCIVLAVMALAVLLAACSDDGGSSVARLAKRDSLAPTVQAQPTSAPMPTMTPVVIYVTATPSVEPTAIFIQSTPVPTMSIVPIRSTALPTLSAE